MYTTTMRTDVESSDTEHDGQVAPVVRSLDVERSEHILVGRAVRAE